MSDGVRHIATLPPGAGGCLALVHTEGDLPPGIMIASESGRIFFLNEYGYLSEIRPHQKPQDERLGER